MNQDRPSYDGEINVGIFVGPSMASSFYKFDLSALNPYKIFEFMELMW